jgi:hypothetical protein
VKIHQGKKNACNGTFFQCFRPNVLLVFQQIGPGCSLLWQALDMCEKLNVAPPSSILLLNKFPPKQETFLPKTSKCTQFYDKFVKYALNLIFLKEKLCCALA